jgi:hypothetical protein
LPPGDFDPFKIYSPSFALSFGNVASSTLKSDAVFAGQGQRVERIIQITGESQEQT